MARRKVDYIVDELSKVVFRIVADLQLIRQRFPNGTIKQTEEINIAGKVFRMADKLSSTLKGSFFGFVDPVAKNILNGIIVQILETVMSFGSVITTTTFMKISHYTQNKDLLIGEAQVWFQSYKAPASPIAETGTKQQPVEFSKRSS